MALKARMREDPCWEEHVREPLDLSALERGSESIAVSRTCESSVTKEANGPAAWVRSSRVLLRQSWRKSWRTDCIGTLSRTRADASTKCDWSHVGGLSFPGGLRRTWNVPSSRISQELPAGIRSVLRDRESSGHVGKIKLNSSKETGVDMNWDIRISGVAYEDSRGSGKWSRTILDSEAP